MRTQGQIFSGPLTGDRPLINIKKRPPLISGKQELQEMHRPSHLTIHSESGSFDGTLGIRCSPLLPTIVHLVGVGLGKQ